MIQYMVSNQIVMEITMRRSRDQLVEVARRYYYDGATQQELAKEFGVSRPTMSGMLKQCLAEKIVEIHVRDGSPLTTALGDEIKQAFDLQSVVVVPSRDGAPSNLESVGRHGANFLSTLLVRGVRVGISWGSSLYHMVHSLPPLRAFDSEVVQLLGGVGFSHVIYDGQELARHLSHHVGGRYYPLYAPIMVNSLELKSMLVKETGIREAINKMNHLNLALLGVSSNEPSGSTLVRAGFLTAQDSQDLLSSGAVGHICGYHIDREGNLLDHPVNQRVMGIEPELLKSVPRRIGIASGAEKAATLLGALRGRWLTDLITDESAALRIMSD